VNTSAYFKPVLLKRKGVALGVWGEAGIGKSYQVTQLLQGLPCRSASFHATTPLSSVANTLPRPKKLATWAERTLARLGKGEAVETSNIMDALGATLAGLAPFVLHLEDIHEVDAERLEFINALAQLVLRSKGVGLIVTSRKEPTEPFIAIKLGPLSQQEAETLLETELKATLPKEALKWIYDKAAGNPLYSLEYLRYLTRQGFLWNDGKHWHWRKPLSDAMPVTVEALIEQLLNQAKAEPSQRYVLETKALLPLDATAEVWAKIARVNEEELQTAITELSQRGIFKEKEFAHSLFREVTLKTLSPERKRNLARRALNILQDKPDQALVFIDDAKLEPQKALELLEKITGIFEMTGKNLEASRCLEQSTHYATGEARGHLALRAARLAYQAGDARSLVLAQQAVDYLGENTATLHALVEAHALRGERGEVQAILRRFTNELDNAWLIRQLFTVGAFDDIAQLYTATLDIEALNEHSLYCLAYVLMDRGDLTQASGLADHRLQRQGLSIDAKAELLDIRASVFHYQGKYQEADLLFSEVIELYKKLPTLWDAVANGLRNRALNRLQMGLYQEVLPDFLESLGLYAERGARVFYAQTLVMMSNVYSELADYDKALDVLTESITIFERIQVQPFYVHALANLAVLYVEHPTSFSGVLAPKYVQQALALSKELKSKMYSAMTYIAGSRVNYFIGDFTLSQSYADEALKEAEEAGLMELTINARTARALALEKLTNKHDALGLLQSNLQTATKHGSVVEGNKIGLELDRLTNDVESARKRMHWFQERGLMNGVNIAKRYFPELTETKEVAKPAANKVRLEVLGSLQARGNNLTPIRGRKRQELLALLLEARISGRSEVSRLTLLDTLYPDDDELKASSRLKTVVHSLRETLGENAITTTSSGYALGQCTSDAELFLQTGDTTLWRELYLEGLGLAEDSTVQDSLYLALSEKVKALLEDNPKEVARVAGILLEAEPYNIDYLKTYLTALRLSNNHGKLTRHYAEAKTRLLEVGETLPDTWQGFLS
jgi:tetratricopeptide (TPR) repeat protein